MYVDATDNCNTAAFQLGQTAIGTTLATRSWSIKVSYMKLKYPSAHAYFTFTSLSLVLVHFLNVFGSGKLCMENVLLILPKFKLSLLDILLKIWNTNCRMKYYQKDKKLKFQWSAQLFSYFFITFFTPLQRFRKYLAMMLIWHPLDALNTTTVKRVEWFNHTTTQTRFNLLVRIKEFVSGIEHVLTLHGYKITPKKLHQTAIVFNIHVFLPDENVGTAGLNHLASLIFKFVWTYLLRPWGCHSCQTNKS